MRAVMSPRRRMAMSMQGATTTTIDQIGRTDQSEQAHRHRYERETSDQIT